VVLPLSLPSSLLCDRPLFAVHKALPVVAVVQRRIVTGQFEFEPAEWATVSNAAKHLVCQLLRVDPSARYTMAQALLHPWLTGEGGDDLDVIPVKPTYNESDVAKLQLFAGSRRSSFTSLSSDGSGNGPGGSSGISTSAAAGGGGVASMEREAEGKAAAADDASPASRASGVGHGGSYGGGGGGGGSGSAAAAGAGGSGGVQWAGAKLESQFRDSAVQSPVLSTPTMSRYPGFLAPLRTPRASDRGTDAEDAPIRDGAASSTVDLAGARSGSVATDASAASLLTFSTDRDGRVTYMSDVLLDRLGYSRAEVVGQPCSSFLSSASLDVLRMLKVAGSCLQTPFVLIRRNGEPWEVRAPLRCTALHCTALLRAVP
jgi:PAS domain-containing protein